MRVLSVVCRLGNGSAVMCAKMQQATHSPPPPTVPPSPSPCTCVTSHPSPPPSYVAPEARLQMFKELQNVVGESSAFTLCLAVYVQVCVFSRAKLRSVCLWFNCIIIDVCVALVIAC